MPVLQAGANPGTTEYLAIIGMLGSTIAALFSFCVWQYKQSLNRADKRIETLETREQQGIEAVTRTVESIATMMTAQLEISRQNQGVMTEVRALLAESRQLMVMVAARFSGPVQPGAG